MTEQEAAYMAGALADGQHMTEAGAAGMARESRDACEFTEAEPAVKAYIEMLEGIALAYHEEVEAEYGRFIACVGCGRGGSVPIGVPRLHAPDCIIPALIAKRALDSERG